MTYYTLDRTGALEENRLIEFQNLDSFSPEIREQVTRYYQGLSLHGLRYYLQSNTTDISTSIDMFFEIGRRAKHASKPSRFSSMFAWESLDDAKHFQWCVGGASSRIFEVHSEGISHRGNMELLKLFPSSIQLDEAIDDYWMGRQGSLGIEKWEIILELPVKIGKQI